MDGGKRHIWENNGRSQNKKSFHGFWRPKMTSWEKDFCKVAGSMSWKRFLQRKKYTHLYPKVMEWNDCAGEEAFTNAKTRFWTEIHGFSSKGIAPLPDPDLYNNKIDWDSEIDPELGRDLDSISEVCDDGAEEADDKAPVFVGDPLNPATYQAIKPTGWGVDDDNFDAPAVPFAANYGGAWGSSNWKNVN